MNYIKYTQAEFVAIWGAERLQQAMNTDEPIKLETMDYSIDDIETTITQHAYYDDIDEVMLVWYSDDTAPRAQWVTKEQAITHGIASKTQAIRDAKAWDEEIAIINHWLDAGRGER